MAQAALAKVRSEVDYYDTLWNSRDTKGTQTELFRKIVPHDLSDFTGPFVGAELDGMFTSEKVKLPIVFGNHNCLHLFRDSQGETKLPVYSDENYTVLHPMGEPGRDMGTGCATKSSHLMIIKHGSEGPIDFNPLLPHDPEELKDFEERLKVLALAYEKVQNNSPLSECGPKVLSKAESMGVSKSCGIRTFLITMITSLSEEDLTKAPGYKLLDSDDVDIVRESGKVADLVNTVFTNGSLKLFTRIQPPSCNSQLLGHIHGFLAEGLHENMDESYMDCEAILSVKKERMVPADQGGCGEAPPEDCALARSVSCA